MERYGTPGAGLVDGEIDRSGDEGLKARSSLIGLRSFMWACPM